MRICGLLRTLFQQQVIYICATARILDAYGLMHYLLVQLIIAYFSTVQYCINYTVAK